jgi:hypothetical protein
MHFGKIREVAAILKLKKKVRKRKRKTVACAAAAAAAAVRERNARKKSCCSGPVMTAQIFSED